MKKYLFLLMAATSTNAFAAPYVGLEYGVTNMSHDYSTTFSDNVSLMPDDSSSAFGGFVGYRFNEFGLEFAYKKFESDDSRSKTLNYHPPVETEREWNADLDAAQFTFKPVYFYNFNEKLQLKTGLG
ncbi:AcfA family outer membrane beta-barrel protein, partial [Aliivibrio sifiae]